jgi:hypothetical protein
MPKPGSCHFRLDFRKYPVQSDFADDAAVENHHLDASKYLVISRVI